MLDVVVFQMALGSQVVAYRLPTKWLWSDFKMALGGFPPGLPARRAAFHGLTLGQTSYGTSGSVELLRRQ